MKDGEFIRNHQSYLVLSEGEIQLRITYRAIKHIVEKRKKDGSNVLEIKELFNLAFDILINLNYSVLDDAENDSYLLVQSNIDIENAIYNCIYFSSIPTNSITKETIEQLVLTIENDSFWILEDIHANPATESLWETLQQNPKVTVTIDTYHFGLVFFRREQVKEHFIIRA